MWISEATDECVSKYTLSTSEVPIFETITTDVEPSEGSQKDVKIRVKVPLIS